MVVIISYLVCVLFGIAIPTSSFTRLYECSLVEKFFKWISKLEDKKPRNESANNAPEVLDGYQLERSVAGD